MEMESWTNDISFIISLRRDVSRAHDDVSLKRQ